MKCATATLLLLAAAGSISADGNRHVRASAGSYSGVSNGQFYGGTYHTPDNGPTVFNRFGDDSQGSASHGAGTYNHGGGAGAGAYGGGGGGGGYAPNYGFGPAVPPFSNPFEFNDFFQGYFKTLSNNLASADQNLQPLTMSSSNAAAQFTESEDMHSAFQKNLQNQRAAWEAAQKAFQTASSNRFGAAPDYNYNYNFDNGPGGNGGNGGAASASASFGPGGGHQSANIYPENPGSPNINNRFASDGPKPGGSYGVSTSSFSSSSNLNGKKTTHKQAQTSINDNGKVTTFVVRD